VASDQFKNNGDEGGDDEDDAVWLL